MKELSNAACKQGELWGRAARDWVDYQEPQFTPLWNVVLDAADVGVGTRLLDAGCGAGGASIVAASRGADVFGIDPSVNMITVARERLPRGDFRAGEIENLMFSNAEFDAVVAINSLQFTDNPQVGLHELGRVCRRGGRVVVAVPGDPATSDISALQRAMLALFETPPTGRGPFELSAPGILESLVASVTELRFDSIQYLDTAWEYPDVDIAVRAMMSAGVSWRAAEILGEDRVRSTVREVMERFRQPDGHVRMMNRFQYMVAIAAHKQVPD